jgi:hypothetical protein
MVVLLKRSSMLRRSLPEVRILCLLNTLQRLDPDAAVTAFLENMASSPYIPPESKDALAMLVLTHEWEALEQAIGCEADEGETESEFVLFRKMVIAVFSRSKVVARTTEERRRTLGAAIHSQQSIEELKELAIQALTTSKEFVGEMRDKVVNDIFDDRYDHLLLADRFDCEEVTRIAISHPDTETPEESVHECPVCLGVAVADVTLPCQHQFCGDCIRDWASREPTCPMCRQGFSINIIR